MNDKALRILAVGAHPDDLEILCGGTLAKYAKLGHTVIMSHLLNGDKGHYQIPPKKIAQIRALEAVEASKVIGAEMIGLGIPDAELFSDLPTRTKVIDLIRQTRPDLIITHAPQDYMSDHVTTSQVVCDASFYTASVLLKTEHEVCEKIVPVFFMDTLAGVNFLPSEYVDITEIFAHKKTMIEKHQSQLKWLKDHDNIDILGFVEKIAAFRGLQCGVQYAEAFRQYEVWPRKVPHRLLP